MKEIASLQLTCSDYSYCIQDISEDGQNEEESGDDCECDLLLDGFFCHEFKLTHSYGRYIKPKNFSDLRSPFNEIHLPPPELI